MVFGRRKSIKIAPGVKLNFSKSGVGYSIGGKGLRYTQRADGRESVSGSVAGFRYSSTSSGSSRSRRTSRSRDRELASEYAAALQEAWQSRPSVFTPKPVKQLYAAMQSGDTESMERIRREHPELALPAASLGAVFCFNNGEYTRAERFAESVFASGEEPATNPFVQKYVRLGFHMDIVAGVSVYFRLGRTSNGLILANVRRELGNIAGAIEVVEQLDPSTYVKISLAGLYCQGGRHQDTVRLTDGITNTDDRSALLLVFRGESLRELGHYEASRSALREALKSKKRDATVRHRGLFARALTYEAEGKKSLARKDYERILAEDSSYNSVQDALARLRR